MYHHLSIIEPVLEGDISVKGTYWRVSLTDEDELRI